MWRKIRLKNEDEGRFLNKWPLKRRIIIWAPPAGRAIRYKSSQAALHFACCGLSAAIPGAAVRSACHFTNTWQFNLGEICFLLFSLQNTVVDLKQYFVQMNNLKIYIPLLFFFIVAVTANAADTIEVKKDPRLDVLTAKQAAINRVTSKLTSTGLYKGFRLQVLNTRSREEAFKMKADLMRQFPDQKTYMYFQSPYFKVRFGNFPERNEAERYKKELSLVYSQGIYVVEDGIEYNPPEEDTLSGN